MDARMDGTGGTGGTTLEQYAEMLALINTDLRGAQARPIETERMFERFGLTAPRWDEITTFWMGRLGRDHALGTQFGARFVARLRELDEEWLAAPTLV